MNPTAWVWVSITSACSCRLMNGSPVETVRVHDHVEGRPDRLAEGVVEERGGDDDDQPDADELAHRGIGQGGDDAHGDEGDGDELAEADVHHVGTEEEPLL